MVEYTDYRLAFILPQTHQLLGLRGYDSPRLPRISIPRWERPAQQLTLLIEEKWKIKTIVLDFISSAHVSCPCAIIEVISPCWQFAHAAFSVVHPAHISKYSCDDDELRSLTSILNGENAGRGCFSRLGWIGEAERWIEVSVGDRAVVFSGDILQLNAGGTYALVRFGTRQGPAYWLKATGIPNSHEFIVTKMLATHFPQSLPRLIAAREEWNAWLTEDAGSSLRDSITLPVLEQAALSMAELQVKSVDHVEELLAAGCFDQRLAILETHLGELIGYLEEAMRDQVSTRVPRLEGPRLKEIGEIVHAACSEMQALYIPDSLTHNDINLGNILSDGSRCVFTDWAEASVGNPFLTVQNLSVHVARLGESACTWASRMKTEYKQPWLDLLPAATIDRALVIAPLLAIAVYLYGRGEWLRSPRRADPNFSSYARSLARCMDRAARSPEMLEALCH